jgi:hypothetical protein
MRHPLNESLAKALADNSRRGRKEFRPPASEEDIEKAESRLGFPLPDLLKQLYREVGNGGFAGLFSLDAIVWQYHNLRGSTEIGLPQWPERLIPICDWGCSILSSLDCSMVGVPVIRNDPNEDYEDIKPKLAEHQRYDEHGRNFSASWIEAPSLEEWLYAWVNREDLFSRAYPKDV